MFIDSQRLGYKINPIDQRYSQRIQDNLTASRGTFTDLETPGWTSLMRSEISDRTKRNHDKENENKQTDIYNKLNQGQKLKWSQADQKKMLRSKPSFDKNDTRDTGYAKPQSISRRQISRQVKNLQHAPKRFNQITVHQHLYKDSKKLENKKMINKILDEEFKKKQIFKFTPTINKKSIILAQSKFSRLQQVELSPKKHEASMQTQSSNCRQKQDKEVQKYRVLNKSFYFLSSGKTLLTQQSLKNKIIQLPIPCIEVIQPIINKIFSGQQMQWLDFLQNFNDKNLKGKQKFYTIIAKWIARMQKAQVTKLTDPQKSLQ